MNKRTHPCPSAPILALLALLLAALACNVPTDEAAKPTLDVGLVVAQTQTAVAVQQFLTATAQPQAALPPTSATQAPPPAATSAAAPTITKAPSATSQPPATNCVDKAKFLSETVPDDTQLSPGAAFTKSWTLQNAGTCTWSPGYNLNLSGGDRMGAPSPFTFNQSVPPNGTIVLQVPMTAPAQPARYKGYWKLRNASNHEFGSLWVQIVVSGEATPMGDAQSGPPTWKDSFESGGSVAYDLGSDSDTNYQVDNGRLIMTALTQAGDQWRISGHGYVTNFYVEAHFKTGDACSDQDSYGIIVRAPDQPDSIVDTGYVFVFSCEGKYRVYRMDNGGYTGLINWSAAQAIVKGPNQSNTLGLQAKGDMFRLYANGQLIAEFSDDSYATGYFGLVIRSKVTTKLQVAIEDISLWELP